MANGISRLGSGSVGMTQAEIEIFNPRPKAGEEVEKALGHAEAPLQTGKAQELIASILSSPEASRLSLPPAAHDVSKGVIGNRHYFAMSGLVRDFRTGSAYGALIEYLKNPGVLPGKAQNLRMSLGRVEKMIKFLEGKMELTRQVYDQVQGNPEN